MFTVSIVAMLAFAATEPLFAAMMQPLIDGSFVDRNEEIVRLMPLVLVALFVFRGIAGFINNYSLSWVGRRVVADLRQKMFEHLLRCAPRRAITTIRDRDTSSPSLPTTSKTSLPRPHRRSPP